MAPTPFLLLHLFLLWTAALTTTPLPAVTSSSPPLPQQFQQEDHHDPQQMMLLTPILSNLGFQELSMAVSALSSPVLTSWSGPITVFAPSDDSVRSCASCSATLLLREHSVSGLFTHRYLSKLAFGTKLETTSSGRCLTITSTAAASSRQNASSASDPSKVKVFVEGIEITRPDLFNDGRIVIHGIQGFVTPLSPLSCNLEVQDVIPVSSTPRSTPSEGHGDPILRLMLRDAMVRLRDAGFSILALAMRVKYAELASLQNMTIFAVDDSSIFAGGHSYVTSVRYHVVPNMLLMHGDLMRLPAGTPLPTLVHGQDLMITHPSAGDPIGLGFRINYVPIKRGDVVFNLKIAVHSIFLPFPHLQPADLSLAVGAVADDDGMFGAPAQVGPDFEERGSCLASSPVGCGPVPSASPFGAPIGFTEHDGF